jgi:hypothetical protein
MPYLANGFGFGYFVLQQSAEGPTRDFAAVDWTFGIRMFSDVATPGGSTYLPLTQPQSSTRETFS